MSLRKTIRAVKIKLTPLIALTMALIALASIFAAVQLFVLSLPAAGISALLAGTGVILLTWKIQVTSVTSKELQRQMKSITLARAAATPTTTVVDAAAPAAPATPSIADKLRVIGTYTPPPSKGDQANPGRVAARVATDPDSAFRLFAATHGMGAPAASVTSPRAIALVGSDELARVLADVGSVYRLHPSVSAAELEHAQPMTLIVEEDALNGGPWSGALEPQGARLLLELRVAMAWMRRHNGAIYVVCAKARPGIAAFAMRADTILIDDDLVASQRPDDPASLATILVAHRTGGAVA